MRQLVFFIFMAGLVLPASAAPIYLSCKLENDKITSYEIIIHPKYNKATIMTIIDGIRLGSYSDHESQWKLTIEPDAYHFTNRRIDGGEKRTHGIDRTNGDYYFYAKNLSDHKVRVSQGKCRKVSPPKTLF
ncbi:hypothetical protein [Synechococcus sp. UW69]|uniref:hypothetical protein n=1 Tax=Synechococcus sp. UW69 TaxID=368493 RepID=UPI000E0EDB0E|nr:hypothetical protein [Synechococcus sp. UW69]